MAAYLLYRCKHLCMLIFRVVSRLVNGNVIPVGIPWETSHGMGQHTFIFPMRQNESVRMLLNCHTYTILLNFKVNKFCRFACLFVHVVLFSRY